MYPLHVAYICSTCKADINHPQEWMVKDYLANNLDTAVKNAYARGETDEFVKPTIISDSVDKYNNYKINLLL